MSVGIAPGTSAGQVARWLALTVSRTRGPRRKRARCWASTPRWGGLGLDAHDLPDLRQSVPVAGVLALPDEGVDRQWQDGSLLR